VTAKAAPATSQSDAKGLILVRPDGYVGFAGADSDRAGAEVYLRALMTDHGLLADWR